MSTGFLKYFYHALSGVRVDGAAPRGFLRFLSLTAFQAEGCGSGFAADFKNGGAAPPQVVSKGCVPTGEMLIKSALRINLSASYGK